MLTIDLDRLGVTAGSVVLDLGCGKGRHSFEAFRRGALVVGVDLDAESLREAAGMTDAMEAAGDAPRGGAAFQVRADALRLPFADDSFDYVMASEVLEHIPFDESAMQEIARVLKPGGSVAVSVPRWWPERVCWALSESYRTSAGGHIRIYKRAELAAKLARNGFEGADTHHSHALHSPYWWLRCAFGIDRERAAIPALYHRLLVWQIVKAPPALSRIERALNPVLGKSLVLYAHRDGAGS